jgi:hypothetical protein
MVEARHELAKLAKAARRLLPQAAPSIPGFNLVVSYKPAFIAAGDYYGF